MYTYSVSGYDDNNKVRFNFFRSHVACFSFQRFSPCSRRNIKAVLEAKAHLCFQGKNATKIFELLSE